MADERLEDEMVNYLLSKPCKRSSGTCFLELCEGGYPELASLIYTNRAININKNGIGFVALRRACFCGNLPVVKYLLDLDVIDIHQYDEQILIQAISSGHFDVARLLMEQGQMNPYAQDGIAIQYCCQYGWLDFLQEIVVPFNPITKVAYEKGFTFACANDQLEIVKFLHEVGVDIHTNEDAGFKMAYEDRCHKVIPYLLSLDEEFICIATKDDDLMLQVAKHENVQLILEE